jgi:hypothetical protein
MIMGKQQGHDPELESKAERYAAGRMGYREEREFEVLMLESPEVASRVDAIHRIRVGFRELQARGELEKIFAAAPAIVYSFPSRRLQ